MKSSVLSQERRSQAVSNEQPRSQRRVGAAPKRGKSGQPPGPERLLEMAWGFAPPLILETALRYGIFDLLEKGPLTLREVAARTGGAERGLTAILNALVSFGLLRREHNRYALTPESEAFLVSSRPAYYGGYLRHTIRQLIPRWLGLPEVVRTGRPVFRADQEDTAAEFFAGFVEGLFPLSYRAAQALGEHLGIPGVLSPVSVLDIGAGSGVWGIALAHQSPHVTVHAVDWPRVIQVTSTMARRHGVEDRVRFSSGDLLEADFGSSHHVATIGHILHSQGPERSRKLLQKTHAALAPGGTVAISEFVPNESRTGPPHTLIFAVNMLLNTEEGDTFTFSEIAGWLSEAGFENPRELEAPSPSPLIIATKP